MGLSGGMLARVPGKGRTRRNYRAIARYSAALGLVTDLSLLTLGGKLKFKEKLSARLGDVLSQLYIISAILKRFEDQDQPQADLPLLAWACQDAIYRMEEALDQFLRNLTYHFSVMSNAEFCLVLDIPKFHLPFIHIGIFIRGVI